MDQPVSLTPSNSDQRPHRPEEEPASPSGWISILAASAILFIGIGYTNTFGVFQEHYQNSLLAGEPEDRIILIGSISSSLYFILGSLTGRLADIVGYRVSLLVGSFLMVGSMFAASVSKEFWQLLLSQGVGFGLGVAFVYPPATSISRQYFGPGRHGMANGIVVSGGALGGCVLPYPTRIMIRNFGLERTFRLLGYLAVGVLIPSIVLIRPKQTSRSHALRSRLFAVELLANGRFICLVVACTIAMIGFLPRYFLIPSSAVARGISSSYAPWLLGIMNGLSIIGRVGIGSVADRFGPVNALSASFTLCACSHFILWLPGVAVSGHVAQSSTILFTLFVVFVGLFGSGFISLFPVVVAHLFGSEDLASKTGLLNSFVGLSTLAGPSVVYAIVDAGKGQRWTFGVLTAGIFMLGGGLVLVADARVNAVRRAS